MKAAIIGASEEALHTIEKARELGIDTIAADGDPQAAGLQAADQALVVDISREEATIEAMRQVQPDFILTVPIGRYLTTIGAVNDALGLPGVSREAAALCTDKYRFHQILSAHGLRNGECHLIPGDETTGGTDVPLTTTYPAILKPRYGSGSRGIFFIRDQKEQQDALRQIAGAGEDYILEHAASGEEYGVDAVVTEQKFQIILLRRKINTPPPDRQAVGYLAVMPKEQEDLYRRVTAYMTQVAQTMNLQECLFHADLMIEEAPEDPIFVIELSARPSGHNLHNLFTPLATGVDMAEQYLRYRAGMDYSFLPCCTEHMLIHYFDMEGVVTSAPSEKEVVEALQQSVRLRKWLCTIGSGERLCHISTGHSLMGRGYFILSGSTEERLLEAAETVKELFGVAKTGAASTSTTICKE